MRVVACKVHRRLNPSNHGERSEMEEDEESRGTLLEVYKLHASLAEQAAASREGLNKLYTGNGVVDSRGIGPPPPRRARSRCDVGATRAGCDGVALLDDVPAFDDR